jgi:hypothetical protein
MLYNQPFLIFPDQSINDPLVEAAQEAWADLLRLYAHLATGVRLHLDVPTIYSQLFVQINLDKKLPKSRARSASVNSDMSTTSNSIAGPSNLACRSPSIMSIASDAHPSESNSSTSHRRAPLLKAKSKVIPDSDKETDDNAANPSVSDSDRLKRLGKMRANDLSDDDEEEEEEEDPITDPVIKAQIDALVASTLSGLSNQHPYLEAITSETENPRLLALGLYLALLKVDALQKHGLCQFCFSDPNKSMKDQLNQWTDNLSVHLWKCEDTHSPGFWCCPCCGQMVQCGDPDPTSPLSPPELEAITADLIAHREDCYKKTLVKLGFKPKSEEEELDDTEDSEPPPDSSNDDEPSIEVEVCSDSDNQKNPLHILLFFLSQFSFFSPFSKCPQVVIWRWLSLPCHRHQVGWGMACSPVAVLPLLLLQVTK